MSRDADPNPARRDLAAVWAGVFHLVTASGVTLFGVGSAFWGLLVGLLARHATRPR